MTMKGQGQGQVYENSYNDKCDSYDDKYDEYPCVRSMAMTTTSMTGLTRTASISRTTPSNSTVGHSWGGGICKAHGLYSLSPPLTPLILDVITLLRSSTDL